MSSAKSSTLKELISWSHIHQFVQTMFTKQLVHFRQHQPTQTVSLNQLDQVLQRLNSDRQRQNVNDSHNESSQYVRQNRPRLQRNGRGDNVRYCSPSRTHRQGALERRLGGGVGMAGEETKVFRNPTGSRPHIRGCLVDLGQGRGAMVAEVELTRDTEVRDELRW